MKTFLCKHCGKENSCKSSTTNTYCNNTCQMAYQRQQNIDNWLHNGYTWEQRTPTWVRSFLFERDGECCSKCKIVDWNGEPLTLECDHVDGNSRNCSPDNLRMICPNCHSQTATYKARNKGNGRGYRKKRYDEGKSF